MGGGGRVVVVVVGVTVVLVLVVLVAVLVVGQHGLQELGGHDNGYAVVGMGGLVFLVRAPQAAPSPLWLRAPQAGPASVALAGAAGVARGRSGGVEGRRLYSRRLPAPPLSRSRYIARLSGVMRRPEVGGSKPHQSLPTPNHPHRPEHPPLAAFGDERRPTAVDARIRWREGGGNILSSSLQ